jgi:Kdo2-lipid IVA lauroyltransferase/acyltransferase
MLLIRLLSRLPFSVLYVISDFCFIVTFYIVRYRRKLVQKNLRNSFPNKTAGELREIERRYFQNLCDYAVEMLKLLTISKQELSERMRFENPEVLQNFADHKQSIIFMASHQFNWEWSLVSASIVFPFDIDFVYQPIKNKFFERFSLLCRTRFGAFPIQREDVARALVKRRHVLRGVATVADQYPGLKKDKKFAMRFLNQETVFFLGTNSMIQLSQYPAVYYSLKKVKRGYYVGTPHIVGLPPYDKTSTTVLENYIREVEKVIEQDPAGWLWSHNRWKKRHLTQAELAAAKNS